MSRRSSWQIGAALLVSLAVTSATSAALGQDRTRVAVVDVDGPQAARIRGHIEAALGSHVELVDAGSGRAPSTDEGFAELAQRLDVQAMVTARIKKARRFVVTVTVRQGNDGAVVATETWSDKKAPKLSVIERELWRKLGSAIDDADGPARAREPEPTPTPSRRPARADTSERDDAAPQDDEEEDEEEAEEEEEEESADTDGASERRPALRVELGFGPMWRDQAYNDSARDVPFRYFNEIGSPAMWLSVSGAWYPVALASDSMLGNLGLVAGFGTAIGLSSEDEAGNAIDTSASAFHIGLRGRLPIDRSELGLTIAYGGRNFSTEAPAATPIPDVSHRYLRLAADGHIALSDAFGLELNAGYLLRLGSGELEDDAYFPELSGGGIEVGAAAVMALGDSGLSLRAGLDWQRFFFSLNPAVDAPRVAGGSVDNYYTLNISARYELTTK